MGNAHWNGEMNIFSHSNGLYPLKFWVVYPCQLVLPIYCRIQWALSIYYRTQWALPIANRQRPFRAL